MLDSTNYLLPGTHIDNLAEGVTFQSTDLDFKLEFPIEEDRELQQLTDGLESLRSILADTKSIGLVSRPVMEEIALLSSSLESFQQMTARYPMASFTASPSTQNLNPAMESMLGAVKDMVIKAVKRLITLILQLIQGAVNILRQLYAQVAEWLSKRAQLKEASQSLANLRAKARALDDEHFKKVFAVHSAAYNERAKLKFAAKYTRAIEWYHGVNSTGPTLPPFDDFLTVLASDIQLSAVKVGDVAVNLRNRCSAFGTQIKKARSVPAFISAQDEFVRAMHFDGRPIDEVMASQNTVDFVNALPAVSARLPDYDHIDYFQNAAYGMVSGLQDLRREKLSVVPENVLDISEANVTFQRMDPVAKRCDAAKNIADNQLIRASLGIGELKKVIDTVIGIHKYELSSEALEALEGLFNETRAVADGVEKLIAAQVEASKIMADAMSLEVLRLKDEADAYKETLKDPHIGRDKVAALALALRGVYAKLSGFGVV